MRTCAYCGEAKKLTREHIIPNWYIKKEDETENNFFLAKAKSFLKSDLVVKDVCSQCNGGPLSHLDNYGKKIFDKYLTHFIYKGQVVRFSYDYSKFIKWLVKLSYNSSRANDSDFEILSQYANVLITDNPIPDNIFVYCGLVAPSIIKNDEVHLAEKSEESMFEPDWFRIGVFRVADFNSLNWSFRHVSINSYIFYIFASKLSGSELKSEYQLLRKAIDKETRFGQELSRSGVYQSSPVLDAFNSYDQQASSYPIAHELHSDSLIQKFRDKQSPMLNIQIDRKDIEANDYSNIIPILDYLVSSKEVVMEFKQKVEFSVNGYDRDPRFLHEIPEVVIYLKKLNKHFQFWIFFQFEHGIWLKALLICLCNNRERDQAIVFAKHAKKQLNEWFIAQNKLCHRFAIEEHINREISNNVVKVIKRDKWPSN